MTMPGGSWSKRALSLFDSILLLLLRIFTISRFRLVLCDCAGPCTLRSYSPINTPARQIDIIKSKQMGHQAFVMHADSSGHHCAVSLSMYIFTGGRASSSGIVWDPVSFNQSTQHQHSWLKICRPTSCRLPEDWSLYQVPFAPRQGHLVALMPLQPINDLASAVLAVSQTV